MAILIPEKAGIRTGKIARDKEGHNITTKESVLQEDITIPNM